MFHIMPDAKLSIFFDTASISDAKSYFQIRTCLPVWQPVIKKQATLSFGQICRYFY